MNPIEQKLRSVIAEHGLKDTYVTFQSVLKGDYEYLQSLFSQTISELHSSASPSQSSPPLTQLQKEQEEPKKRGRGRPPKQTVNEVPNKKTIVHVTKEPQTSQPIPSQTIELPPPLESTPPPNQTPAENKIWQKEQEDLRRQQLEELGIQPIEHLTVENMRKWVDTEKLSYAHIARCYLGLSSTVVAAFAKENHLISDAAKRRQILAGQKARAKRS